MRRVTALLLTAAMSLSTSPVFAARAQVQGGTITGTAQGVHGEVLSSHTVRLRNVATGQLAGSTTTNAGGQFTFASLTPGSYVVEIVDQAGTIIGTSSAITVAAGGTVAVTVGATAAAAAAAAAGGGTAFLASTAGIVTVAAIGAGVAGIAVAKHKKNKSPSK